jgi:hypothetical protein
MKPKNSMTNIVKNIATGEVLTLRTLNDLAMYTGFSAGFLGNKLCNGVKNYNLSNEYIITRRKTKKKDVFDTVKVKHEKRTYQRSRFSLDVFIGLIDGVYYYIDENKKIKKSTRTVVGKYNHLEQVKHLPVTEEDYKKFDVEALYQEKFVEWRKKPLFRDDITLFRDLLQVILFPDLIRTPSKGGKPK